MGVVVSDLDRTLTDAALRPSAAALDVLAELRGLGLRVVLATGRRAAELEPAFLERFDGLVLEGGAVIGQADHLRTVGDPDWVRRVTERLDGRQVPFDAGRGSVSVAAADRDRLDLPPDVLVQPNRDRLDLTPPGVDKGAALPLVAEGIGAVLAFGDAANDASLLQAADHGVAVANAEPALKAVADEVTGLPGGDGVAVYLRRRLLPQDPVARPPGPVS